MSISQPMEHIFFVVCLMSSTCKLKRLNKMVLLPTKLSPESFINKINSWLRQSQLSICLVCQNTLKSSERKTRLLIRQSVWSFTFANAPLSLLGILYACVPQSSLVLTTIRTKGRKKRRLSSNLNLKAKPISSAELEIAHRFR